MAAVGPSLAAQCIAMHRAAHQMLDHPRLFDDPLAIAILGEERSRFESHLAAMETARERQTRAFITARSRYAEDELATAVARGATQYVMVGAGLDTYAYRNTHPNLRIFEVDHPAVQAWKRTRLAAAGIAIPPSVVFVPANFDEQPLCSALDSMGFQRDQVSFFSWLGATTEITASSAMATLAFIGSLPAGTAVVFDYAIERSSIDSEVQLAMDALASRIAGAGEPFRWFVDARALGRLLRLAGFREVEDLGPDGIRARYFTGQTDCRRVSTGVAHLVNART